MLVDDYDGLVDGIDRLLSDQVLREQLGSKAQVRSGEFSWRQSADAMRTVLDSMHAGQFVSGVV
jgi:glycosyltransferase involved in cell wall biosynthesis